RPDAVGPGVGIRHRIPRRAIERCDMTIITLIIQIVAGIIGGNAVGAGMKNMSMGGAGNTIAGGVGGLAGGWILSQLAGMGYDASSIGPIIGQIVGGGVGGAILTAIVGAIMKSMNRQGA